MVAAMVLLCGGLATRIAHAQATPEKTVFSMSDLNRYVAADTPQAERTRLWKSFDGFKPTTPADVDLLYSCFDHPESGLEVQADDKLCAMRDKALLERSRKYLDLADRSKAEVAIRVAHLAKDKGAIPALRKLISDTRDRDEYVDMVIGAKGALAAMGDRELLKELSDPARMTEDPTERGYYLEVLKLYGDEGIKAVKNLADKGKVTPEEYAKFISQTSGKEAAKELIKAYRSAKTMAAKAAAIRQLAELNTTECQPVLHEALDDGELMALRIPASETGTPFDTPTIIKTAILEYDSAEAHRLRLEFIRLLTDSHDLLKQYHAFQIVELYPADVATEKLAALTLAGMLNSERGAEASEALEKLTGQAFQYKRPKSSSHEYDQRDKRRERGSHTAADEGITAQSIAGSEKNMQDELTGLHARLEANSRFTPEAREKIFKQRESSWQAEIDRQKKLLNTPLPPDPSTLGIPTNEAVKWIKEHYANEETRNVQP